MITNNISTLKIHKLTQEQYDRELAAGNIDENAIYLTPDTGADVDFEELTEEEIEALCEFDGDADDIIPIATPASIGCVSIGDGLDVDDNGLLSVQSLTDAEIESICEFDEGMTEANVIPKATRTALGCIKVGDGLAIDSSGRLSATGGGGGGVATAGIGSAGMKLLWENPDPNAEFSAQTIELDLSKYEMVRIFYYDRTDKGSYGYLSTDVLIGSNGGLQTSTVVSDSYIIVGSRNAEASISGITFGDGRWRYTNASNDSGEVSGFVCIPYQIYGVDVAPPDVDYTLTEEKDIQELLWENPDPTADFAAQTVNLDLSEYDFLRIKIAGYPKTSSDYPEGLTQWFEVKKAEPTVLTMNISFFDTTTGSNAYWGARNCVVSDTGIQFEQGISYKVNDTSSHTGTVSNGTAVPVQIYGIKNKINVTTAVVTDKGQYTDLLWENASPSAEFVAQTISLDLNGYDEIRIDYRPFYDKTNLKSNVCKIGDAAILDLVMSNMGYVNASAAFIGFRGLSATTTGVTFNTGYSYSATDDRCCIPVAIYGIKHNAATTSTIMGDYIVEEGADDIWTWRKWNSGIAECWGQQKVTVPASGWTAWGNLFLKSVNAINYPFEFAEVPFDTINVAMNGGNGMTNAYNDGTTTATARVDIVRANNLSAECGGFVKYYAKGRWK